MDCECRNRLGRSILNYDLKTVKENKRITIAVCSNDILNSYIRGTDASYDILYMYERDTTRKFHLTKGSSISR